MDTINTSILSYLGAELHLDRNFYLEFPSDGYYFYSKGDYRYEMCERLFPDMRGNEDFLFKIGVTPRCLEEDRYTFIGKEDVTTEDALFFAKVLRAIGKPDMANFILKEFLTSHELMESLLGAETSSE